jgi:hypothetical protein
MVVLALIASCQFTEDSKAGPGTAHTTTTRMARQNEVGDPTRASDQACVLIAHAVPMTRSFSHAGRSRVLSPRATA